MVCNWAGNLVRVCLGKKTVTQFIEREKEKVLRHAHAVLRIMPASWQQVGVGEHAKVPGLLTH